MIMPYQNPFELRAACRRNEFKRTTTGQALGFEQANIVILPTKYTGDFQKYCEHNPQACPLLSVGSPGDPALPDLGEDIDVRYDLPLYRVFRNGHYEGERTSIGEIWREDLIVFALGCSLSFERALIEAGIRLRYVATGESCAAYRTERPTKSVGPFKANLVVTFRGIREDQVERVQDITRRFPLSHGGPVHTGNPAVLGIENLGENIKKIGLAELSDDEVAMFWACGVTAVDAVQAAAADLTITHSPSHMLITDRPAFRVE